MHAQQAATAALKILCLHGGGTNVEIMRLQTAKFRRMCPAAQFDFLNGPRVMERPLDPSIGSRFKGPFRSWYDVTYEDVPDRPYLDTLMDPSITFDYPDAEVAIDKVESHIALHGPYDALLGFSQGAILITLMTARALHEGQVPSWRSNVLVCSMPVRAKRFLPLLRKPLAFPAVVAQGAQDPYYSWCSTVGDSYVDAKRVEYPDGHRFPHAASDNEAIVAAMLTQLGS